LASAKAVQIVDNICYIPAFCVQCMFVLVSSLIVNWCLMVEGLFPLWAWWLEGYVHCWARVVLVLLHSAFCFIPLVAVFSLFHTDSVRFLQVYSFLLNCVVLQLYRMLYAAVDWLWFGRATWLSICWERTCVEAVILVQLFIISNVTTRTGEVHSAVWHQLLATAWIEDETIHIVFTLS
jgi:hypothetical protein